MFDCVIFVQVVNLKKVKSTVKPHITGNVYECWCLFCRRALLCLMMTENWLRMTRNTDML